MAALVAAVLALAVGPAAASAATFEVNSLNDGQKSAGGAVCEATFPGECTLRAAIEAANEGPGADVITFSNAIFNGVAGADEIEPATALPTIVAPVSINGRAVVIGPILTPSVGVKAPAGAAAFKVLADEVTISHVAVGGGEAGIEVLGTSDKFTALGDWFGLRLDATAEAIAGAGLSLGTTADEATIGSGEFGLATGNVFANAPVGIEIKGASKAKIRGNYIGVQPDGTGTSGLETGVRIEDFGAPAEEDEIGGTLGPAEIAAKECVGPCNAIATEGGQGIDLAGSATDPQQAAHGPTFIRGNFLGLEPDGSGTVGTSTYGVLAAPSGAACSMVGPSDVTVGGVGAGEGNFFVGGTFGIETEAAENFSAIGNSFGLNPDGSAAESPGAAAISLCGESVTEPALVAGNKMTLEPDTIGIESNFGQAQILGNSIQGGLYGVRTREAGVGGGNIIQSNTITGTDRQGMLIADDLNVVTGNSIIDAAWAGITIEEGGEHNRIGGDALGEANTINTSGLGNPAGAIQIEGEETSRNEIAANTGSGNVGAFIELDGPGSQIPNGLKPPLVTAALQSSAAGTAAPNTTVRIFSKATSAAGELGGLLAVAKADAAGAWSATFATRPVGTLLAATQTSNAGTATAGTSEVSAPVAAAADPPRPPEPEPETKGGVGTPVPPAPSPPPSPSVPVAPKVKITSGPRKNGTATTVKFKFTAEPAAEAKFECKLDGAKWARCSSPKTYKKLKLGRHTFRARANADGLIGAATKFQFTIKE